MKIKEPFNQDIYFTADTHFGHKNIIEYCDRPFHGNKDMTKTMITCWNNRINENDTVFHLGDFALSSTKYVQEIMDRLNGNIHLIKGNHEKTVLSPKHIREKFESISNILEIKVNDDELDIGYAYIVMCHYAMLRWNRAYHGSWHLFGHSHGRVNHPNPNAFDVGVDCHNFTPLSYQEVKTIITKQNMNYHDND